MHSSVETRYPFLDEDVFAFLARLHPSWKLGGWNGLHDKVLLRRLGRRWLPEAIANRRKAMFRAPFDGFQLHSAPPFVSQLLSEESLRRTGYFDAGAVKHWWTTFRDVRLNRAQRLSIEMGLVGVLATQLWHHTFIDPRLADLPAWTAPAAADFEQPLRNGDRPAAGVTGSCARAQAIDQCTTNFLPSPLYSGERGTNEGLNHHYCLWLLAPGPSPPEETAEKGEENASGAMGRPLFSLKGCNKPAQGNALGFGGNGSAAVQPERL